MLNSPTHPILRANRGALDMRLLAPAPGVPLKLTVVGQGRQLLVLSAAGDVDLATAEHLQAQLHTVVGAGYRRLVVDLSGVGFCDAAGLGAFVSGRQQARARGGWLRLARPQPVVAKLLRITADTRRCRRRARHCRVGRVKRRRGCGFVVPSVDGW